MSSTPQIPDLLPQDIDSIDWYYRRQGPPSPPPDNPDLTLATSEEQQRYHERDCSRPDKQFIAQVKDDRAWSMQLEKLGVELREKGILIKTGAREGTYHVKKCWTDQGILMDVWVNHNPGRFWRHEKPIPDEELPDDLLRYRFTQPREENLEEIEKYKGGKMLRSGMESSWLFSPQNKELQELLEALDKHEYPNVFTSANCLTEAYRRRRREIKLERSGEASRPYHQFTYQVSVERERILIESSREPGAIIPGDKLWTYGSFNIYRDDASRQWHEAMRPSPTADINTLAYERVKNSWIKWRIWNDDWGILPGMTWKHEDPFVVGMPGQAQQPGPVEGGSATAGKAPSPTNQMAAPKKMESKVTVRSSRSTRKRPSPAQSPAAHPRRSKRLQGLTDGLASME